MNPITRISPVSDAEAGRLVRGDTLADLADDITSMSAAQPGYRARRRAGRPGLGRRRLLIGVPAAAALAIAGLVITSLGSPGQKVGPVTIGPPRAQAAPLSITRHGRYIDVIVKDPLADARRYREEFAKYGLNISLKLVPASPSLVGTLVYEGLPPGRSAIIPITAVGKCFTGGGGNVCPVGVKVPLSFKGAAQLVFGRAARPGEPFETTAPANARGELMHGMSYSGKTVAAVLAMLRTRHGSVGRYMVTNSRCMNVLKRAVPHSWFVSGADPWAPGQVLLWVSPVWPARSCTAQGSPNPTPSASPTSTAG